MRKIVLLLAVVAAAASVADYLAWRASHRALRALASQTGLFVRLAESEVELRRETEPARAATLTAWGLLDLEVDRGWLEELRQDERRAEAGRGIDRLRQARRLAEETLPRRPSSWQTAMVLGATRYLEAERTGERHQPISAWRRPLLVAMELAPGLPEPPLFLASASLSRWSNLSQAERDATGPVLARAFEEPAGLELLIEPWARLAPSMGKLLEVIPDRPQAWRALRRVFLTANDLERFATIHERWLEAQPAFVADQATQARDRLRGGDSRSAFGLARRVVGAPCDLVFVKSFSDALAILPEDLESRRTSRDLRRWLVWALDLCQLGACPLEPEAISRLARLAGDLHPALTGMAALAAGDRAGADAAEAEASGGPDPEWHRYWIYKARRLAAAEPGLAREALERASPGGPAAALYWRARESLAVTAGEPEVVALARRELDRLARGGWSVADWSLHDRAYRLVLLSARGHERLRLELTGIPATGAAVELHWDGRILGAAALQPGEDLVWRLPVEAGIHQLEIVNLSGRPLRPGALSLEGAPPPG